MEQKFKDFLKELLVDAKADLEGKRKALIDEFGDDRDLDESFEQGYLNAVSYIKKQFEKLLEPNEEFNGITPKDAVEEMQSWDFAEAFGDDAERLSDAVKRIYQLVEEIE